MKILFEVAREIVTMFWLMGPYLLFGLTIAGILHVLIKKDFIVRHLGKNDFMSVVKASLFGVPLPLCSCGVIPMALSLRKNNASKGATVSFLISTPQTGVDSIAATYGMLGPVFAIFRPVAAFIMGVIGGVVTNIVAGFEKDKDKVAAAPFCEKCAAEQKATEKKMGFTEKIRAMGNYAYVSFLDDISWHLVVGIIIAGLIAFIIPDDFFVLFITKEWHSMILMILVGLPMYICATASIPVVLALMIKGLSPGAAFVFLAVGPATNAATMTIIANVLGKQVLAVYLIVIASLSVFFGYVLNALYISFDVNVLSSMSHMHGNGYVTLINNVAGVLFLILLVFSLARKIKKRFSI
jgi:uncharacterized protein